VSLRSIYSDLLPRVKEAKHLVDLLNRVTMQFEVVLEKGSENVPRVKISVVNTNPNLSILIEPQEFLPKLRYDSPQCIVAEFIPTRCCDSQSVLRIYSLSQ
jgi:hypothetical protein